MARCNKYVIPKRVAGVKIPISLRRRRTLRAIVKDPKLVELAMAALVAAASALTAKGGKVVKGSRGKVRDLAAKFADEADILLDKSRKAGARRKPGAGRAVSPPN